MTLTHKDKESIKLNGLRELLSQTDTQALESDLFIKSTTQKEEKMRMGTKERGKFSKNNQEHIKRK